jgi:NADH-quinone oxidoreductase subunit M
MGLPGLNGFVGEFTILLGAWGAGQNGIFYFGNVWFAAISALGVIMAAVYILTMFQRMFLGPQGEIVEEVKSHGHAIRDLNWREIATVVPLLIFIFWIGLYPAPFFDLMAPAVENLVGMLPIP